MKNQAQLKLQTVIVNNSFLYLRYAIMLNSSCTINLSDTIEIQHLDQILCIEKEDYLVEFFSHIKKSTLQICTFAYTHNLPLNNMANLHCILMQLEKIKALDFFITEDDVPLFKIPGEYCNELKNYNLPLTADPLLSRNIILKPHLLGWELVSIITGYSIFLLTQKALQIVADMHESFSSYKYIEPSSYQLILFTFQALKILLRPDSFVETANPRWEWHDRLFHQLSRKNSVQTHTHGATFRFSQPQRNDINQKDLIYLDGSSSTPFADTKSFIDVLKARRTKRQVKQPMLSIEKLSHFYSLCYQISSDQRFRPFPSGGNLHELNVYFYALNVEGLDKAIYKYLPAQHAIKKVDIIRSDLQEVFINGYINAVNLQSAPHVLIAITAEFNQVNWKYSGIAYALILKNVGVLYQMFYLVATFLDLSPCAVGSGYTTLFSEMMGLDYLTESVVGEFVLSD